MFRPCVRSLFVINSHRSNIDLSRIDLQDYGMLWDSSTYDIFTITSKGLQEKHAGAPAAIVSSITESISIVLSRLR